MLLLFIHISTLVFVCVHGSSPNGFIDIQISDGRVQIPNEITLLGCRYDYAWQEKVRIIQQPH